MISRKINENTIHDYLNTKSQASLNKNYGGLISVTPLLSAAMNGHLSVVEYFMNHKVDVNSTNTSFLLKRKIGLLFILLLSKAILVLLNI